MKVLVSWLKDYVDFNMTAADLAHRLVAAPLLVGVRDEAREPRDQEDGVAQLVAEPEVGGDGGDRTVHVRGQQAAVLILPCGQRVQALQREGIMQALRSATTGCRRLASP